MTHICAHSPLEMPKQSTSRGSRHWDDGTPQAYLPAKGPVAHKHISLTLEKGEEPLEKAGASSGL
jgi:hypothetical protein